MNIRIQTDGAAIFDSSHNQAVNGSSNQMNSVNQDNKGKSIFAGNLNMITDSIEQKRDMARKKAMRVLEDEFSNDKNIDKMIEEQKELVAEVKEETLEYSQQLKDVRAAKEQYIAEYGLDEEGAVPTPEQQVELMEFDMAEDELEIRIMKGKEEAKARNVAVEEIQVERMKSHGMVDAQKEADGIMEAASEEIVGMLVEEAKDHVDETLEEQKEKAEEVKEKKEEEQEKLDAKNKTPQQQAVSNTAETLGELQDISEDCKMIQKELKMMVEVKEMTEEDIKGILIDQQL